ncbi:ATP-binding protein [Amycolatopsis sp.]|jgi:predicted negative regulator of RcsB-dependent stress response|uniref:ATP-binding protein n=1 Tax=Amycolatopsis sp. TaxID=37632 RepID=UPI002E030C5A|nr:tetratricopeptide repeat protein [Amycolatopsis sp.]
MGTGERPVRNDLSGIVRGAVVQSGSIGQVTINSPGPDVPIPSQLPPPPRSFTSRDRELSLLRQWSDDEGPLVAVISGPGGVGKTTIALRWLHDARDSFFDGQLYVDLGAFAPSGPIEPEQVLEWFLLALGVRPGNVPFGLAPRQALYRTMTAGRAMAVLLDNAFSAAQVRPLLPASGDSTVVVTSRWRLAGLSLDGGRFIEVDPLSVDDSVELLGNIVGRGRLAGEDDQAAELARLCGGMPIALSVVGARLSAHPRRSVSREIGNLRNDDRLATLTLDESSVEAIFDVSYTDLPIPEQRAYRMCSLHPGTVFGVEVAAAAVGGLADDVGDSLDALVDRNLIKEISDQRFRYHDLLLLHARRQAEWADSEPDRQAVVRRVVEWYLNRAVDADLVLRATRRRVGQRFHEDREPGFASHREALEWLTDERHNILLAVRSADEHGWDGLTWEFCEAMWGFFLHARNYGDWLEMHAMGIPAAHRERDVVAEACLRAQLCFALTGLRRYDDAIHEGHAALRLIERTDDESTRAMVLGELAGAVQGNGDLAGALAYLKQVKEIRAVIGTERAVALAQRRIGEVLAELGRHDEAIKALREAAETMSSLDRALRARTLTSLASVYLRAGRGSDALPPLTEALGVARELGSTRYEAEALLVLGDFAWQRGDVDEAREHWAVAHQAYSASGDPKAAELADRLTRTPPSRSSDS